MTDGTVEIPLTQGQVAIVDASLADVVGRYKWCAAWSHSNRAFYAVRTDYSRGYQRAVLMHVLVWEYVNGPIPEGLEIDHINGDRLDNRIENLRLVTHRKNMQNRKDQREGRTSSRYPGVSWDKRYQKWKAQILVNSIKEHLGYFDAEEEAHEVYEQVARDIEDKLRMEKELAE